MFENLVISDKCKTELMNCISNDEFENLVISDKCKTLQSWIRRLL